MGALVIAVNMLIGGDCERGQTDSTNCNVWVVALIRKVMKLTVAASAIVLAIGMMACSKPDSSVSSQTSHGADVLVQPKLKQFADGLQVKYRVVTNVPDDGCDKAIGDGRCFQAEIDLTSAQDFNHSDWAIYFSQMRPIQSVQSDEFVITHIQGDLHKITPSERFRGFKQGQIKTIPFRGELWQLSETDAMPNYYLVSGELLPEVIASTKVTVDADTGMEIRPYVESFTDAEIQYKRRETDKLQWATAAKLFDDNQVTIVNPALAVNRLIPTPKSVDVSSDDFPVSLQAGISVNFGTVASADVAAALARLERLGVTTTASGFPINLNLSNETSVEGQYQLVIGEQSIEIEAADAAGFSYALASLASLLDVNTLKLNTLKIIDSPHYPFRGMHVDVARNFHGKAFLFDLMDQMAAYKLNKLHLHMADDEGWRLEIDGLPELTDIGSKRCHDLSENSCLLPQLGSGPDANSQVNGYYSKADYIEILRYASARQIQVIPSMDMPGHSRAAIKSMEARARKLAALGDIAGAAEYQLSDPADKTEYSSVQYYNDNTLNVCLESTYHFIDKVIDEIAKLHQEAGHPLQRYHIGADETAGAWKQSPACLGFVASNTFGVTSVDELGAYFIERVANLVQSKGIEAAGWSDGMSHVRPTNMPAKVQSNIWDIVAHKGHVRAHQQVNLGWDTVLSNPEVLYFDFPYEADPKEHGYYWGVRQNNSKHVFSFMSDNLPANAEQWRDIEDLPFEADDRIKQSESGDIISGPMQKGKGFYGIQGQIWSETLRSDDVVEYMAFPRLLMLAERAWHSPHWAVPYQYEGAVYNQDSGYFTAERRALQSAQWSEIANTLGHKELIKLDKAGISYRVPTPGAKIVDGELMANVAFPGLAIEYRVDGGQWQTYQQPVAVNGAVEVRAIAADGIRKGRSLPVN